MNIWKYIYIKFYKCRRHIVGKTLGEEYTAMLFIASLDCLWYWGTITFIDGFLGYPLLPRHKYLYASLLIGGALIIEKLRKMTMCKEGLFEEMIKEVEEEPHEVVWNVLSIMYILCTFGYIFLAILLWSNRLIPTLAI